MEFGKRPSKPLADRQAGSGLENIDPTLYQSLSAAAHRIDKPVERSFSNVNGTLLIAAGVFAVAGAVLFLFHVRWWGPFLGCSLAFLLCSFRLPRK